MNKTVTILGATSDVAMALASKFAQKGYNLILAARSSNRLANFSADIVIRHKVNVDVIEFDATNYDNHNEITKKIKNSTIVVAAFGVLGDQAHDFQDWENCHSVIESNYVGFVSIINRIVATWESEPTDQVRTIIGISSVAGERGRGSNFIYGSAKAAVTCYLDGLRNHCFKNGIHVITVKPGFINSKMTDGLDLPRPLTKEPEQVANAILKGYQRSKNTIYIGGIWRFIMFVIRSIPEVIFKRMSL